MPGSAGALAAEAGGFGASSSFDWHDEDTTAIDSNKTIRREHHDAEITNGQLIAILPPLAPAWPEQWSDP
ncbi:MAG: hypothetical protein OEU87_06605, partial [Nitrospira sp.]|nr:hypothetical protein [Nitrospira sp.]